MFFNKILLAARWFHIILSQQTQENLGRCGGTFQTPPWPSWRSSTRESGWRNWEINDQPGGRKKHKNHGFAGRFVAVKKIAGWVECCRCGWMNKGWGLVKHGDFFLTPGILSLVDTQRDLVGRCFRRCGSLTPGHEAAIGKDGDEPTKTHEGKDETPSWCGPLVGYLRDAASKIFKKCMGGLAQEYLVWYWN